MLRYGVAPIGAARIAPLTANLARMSTAAAAPHKKLAEIDSYLTKVTRTQTPRPKVKYESLVFGHTFSDHMLEVDWDDHDGWGVPRIEPYHNFSLQPSSIVFHYGLECFEGMKAYIDDNGKARLFRPDLNMIRLNNSCARLGLPKFNGDEYLKCIKRLVLEDKDWIPRKFGYSLYIRPTAIATAETLGVGPSKKAKLFTICSPVGPYYRTGFAPVKLFADDVHARAWPGGIGFTKAGGNYAATILPQSEAAKKGFSQVLWLTGDKHYLTEVGTMNMFTFWKNEKGEKELVTAPLDGTILPGVTRDSILALCRGWGEFKVTERAYTMDEFTRAVKENRMIEAFGAGTAAIVSPIELVQYKGQDYIIPLNPTDPSKRAGALTQRLADTLMGIQYGKIPHEWSVVLD